MHRAKRDLLTQRLWMEMQPVLLQRRPSLREGLLRLDDSTVLEGTLHLPLMGTL